MKLDLLYYKSNWDGAKWKSSSLKKPFTVKNTMRPSILRELGHFNFTWCKMELDCGSHMLSRRETEKQTVNYFR